MCCCNCTDYEVPSATAVLPNMRRVYRLLKPRDIKPKLKDTEVHILWPDNGIWYMADVHEVRVYVRQFLGRALCREVCSSSSSWL